ncbi:MAG: hypothetical protein JW807_09725 [Spirochaetes bacterium]|nr:hypothetical protein [Spirochaetota bacterium]
MINIKEKLVAAVREKDFLAKGVCLLLAVILWAFIITGKTEKLRYKVPVILKNLPSTLAVSSMSDRFATVVVEGGKESLKSINVKGIRAIVDLEDAVAGETGVYRVQVEKQQVPEDVSISLVNSEVSVTVEKKEYKWIRVVPVITGAVPVGKIIIDRVVIPERVMVSGPKSAINDIETVETDDVSVDNETGDIHRQVGIRKDKYGDVVFSEKTFTVKVVIMDMRELAVVNTQVGVRNGVGGYGYEVRDGEVEVFIRLKNNSAINEADVEAFVDAGRLNPAVLFGDDERQFVVREFTVIVRGKDVNPADIISVQPKKVMVKITKKQNI